MKQACEIESGNLLVMKIVHYIFNDNHKKCLLMVMELLSPNTNTNTAGYVKSAPKFNILGVTIMLFALSLLFVCIRAAYKASEP